MPSEATVILCDMSAGDRSGADRLMEIVYDDFHRLAGKYLKKGPSAPSLQPTMLVHEAFIKLVDQSQIDWKGKSHFFAVGARAMRQILVDHARRRLAEKRGGHRQRITLDEQLTVSARQDEDVLSIDEALVRLSEIDEERAQIVELRFFGGLTNEEVAEALGVSRRSVVRKWATTRAWLRRELVEMGGE